MELPQPGVAMETSPHDFACSRGRGDADPAGDGFQPEAPPLERLRHHPAAGDRFPGPLCRDPAFQPADAIEGGQRGADFGFRHATSKSCIRC